MKISRVYELMSIEQQCILRNSANKCDRKCSGCDLVQDDEELLEAYEAVKYLLAIYYNEIPTCHISEEEAERQSEKYMEKLGKAIEEDNKKRIKELKKRIKELKKE